MKGRSLIRWAGLEERRRRQHLGGLQAMPGTLTSVVLGAILASEISRRLVMAPDQELPSAAIASSHLWFAAALAGFSIGVFGAPFRLYWRRDSKLLASLPVPGESLFALALWRSQRTALLVSLALLCALVPMGVLLDWPFALRHLAPLAIGFAGCAWLGPSAALAAGAFVASDKAQSVVASMGGEFQAPRTSWLGIFPGFAATLVALALISCASWTVGGRPPGGSITVIAIVGVGLPIASLVWCWTRASAAIPAAIREVAALDQEILAHVERSTPSGLERFFFSLVLGREARLLADKDASLSRRRYPSPYFLIPLGIAVLWIVSGTQPSSYLPWAGSIYGGLMVYAMVMAKRCHVPPVEIPALLETLPLGRAIRARAKGAQAVLRVAMIALLAGLPLLLRAPDVLSTAVFIGLTTVLATALSLRR